MGENEADHSIQTYFRRKSVAEDMKNLSKRKVKTTQYDEYGKGLDEFNAFQSIQRKKFEAQTPYAKRSNTVS